VAIAVIKPTITTATTGRPATGTTLSARRDGASPAGIGSAMLAIVFDSFQPGWRDLLARQRER